MLRLVRSKVQVNRCVHNTPVANKPFAHLFFFLLLHAKHLENAENNSNWGKDKQVN